MSPPLRILHLEDSPDDAALILDHLKSGGIPCTITCVNNRADFVAALERGGLDLILSDDTLPDFDDHSALALALALALPLPLLHRRRQHTHIIRQKI